MKRNIRCSLLSFLFLAPLTLFSQNDSTLLLTPERLTVEDIITRDLDLEKTRVISASRSLEDMDQVPFTMWVVTAEDILRYGFVTLGDVLRAAPGIRVSQPGNAQEGETFLMRGLSGNQYVKILINDVPVKPGVALGMPVGAQLPIRQAERIEVLYGPAAAIYGNEACAGVVNIILKETERPLFTQADLAFGNNGYNSLDLMLGGKLGKDKKIFRFSLYGSSTVREKTDVFYDENIYNMNHYLPLGLDTALYTENPNFRAAEPGDSLPKTANLQHDSRLLGVNLTWRGIHFTYNRMSRFDHTALGINPLAISYANPSNRLAELMETYSLSFTRTRTKWTTYNTFSAIRYRLDNSSTTTFVFDRLSAALFRAQSPAPDEQQKVLRDIYSSLASDERYTTATGFDIRFESRLNAQINKRFSLDLGVQANGSSGTPALAHYRVPVELKIDGTYSPPMVDPFPPASFTEFDGSGFGQLKWNGKRLYAMGGAAINYYVNYGVALAPRAALMYRIDSSWAVRGNFSTGFKRPSMYARANTYFILDFNGTINTSPEGLEKTENIHAWEAGLRYTTKDFRADLVFFSEKVDYLARPGYLRQQPGIVAPWRYGWENAPGRALSMWGIQGLIRSEDHELELSGDRKKTRIAGRTEIYFQYARGKEWLGDERKVTGDVFNAPRWQFQFRMFFTVNQLELMLASNRQTEALSKAVIYQDDYQRKIIMERFPKFRSWDMMMRFYLSKHFLTYFHVQNLFNRAYSGLDATGTPDDLLYNPQQGRLIRFGVNYNMN
ncbi:MAG: Vitamin B12 transporter BtuB [Saprospiraceae bacterium]|nr:Vitamin B12 transporter BtuB [Saprospiraceae bacterium]